MGSMPGVISLAIPNRNDQHVRSWGSEQEKDEGGFSTPGECPEGMWEREQGLLVGGGPELRNVGECQTDLGEMEWGWREMWGLEASLGWRDAEREIPSSCQRSKSSDVSDIIIRSLK